MLPGLFRTLVGLVIAWFVFRFLDRLFTGRRQSSGARRANDPRGSDSPGQGQKPARDDHLGEYVDFEELDGKD